MNSGATAGGTHGPARRRWCWWPCVGCASRMGERLVEQMRSEPGSWRPMVTSGLVMLMMVTASVRMLLVDAWRDGANRCGYGYKPEDAG